MLSPLVYEYILPHASLFVLVLSRIGGLFLFGPVLSSGAIPLRVKPLLLVGLTVVVYPLLGVEPSEAPPLDLITLAPLIAGEAMVGAVIGLLASLPMMAVQLAGVSMGQQMGLGMAQVVNPALDMSGNSLGQMLFLIALAAYLGFGGMELTISAVLRTFDGAPIGSISLSDAPLGLILGVLGGAFELAIRLALPVVAIIFIESVAAGFIMKTVPSINIMTFGFPIRILIGLFVFLGAVTVSSEVIAGGLDAVFSEIGGWVDELTAPPGGGAP